MSYSITIDTGGTFTDLVLADETSIHGLYKAQTTPDDPYVGILAALEQAAQAAGRSVEEVLADTHGVVYATTHATNAILEGRTARTAFLTTAGHRDILLYREGGKQNPFDLTQPYPEPFVPRSLSFEIPERILCDGRIARPLDTAATGRVIDRLVEIEVEAVGVCLLWSIANPAHERRVGELLASRLPDVPFTLSHELNPKLREYRRASSTVIDASLKPLMRAHLRTIDERLRALGFRGEPLMVTHMSGGVLGLGAMCERPIHSVDSGPALAPVAGLVYARVDADVDGPPRADAAAKRDLLVVDAGGTSVDISPTRDGRIVYSREKWLGERWKGHMTGLPAVETNSIGAGGGSIASVDVDGLLTVGPRSAGARPGPACYDRGGEHATVTDAALLLGYLDPAFFLGGRMRVVPERARSALAREVAGPLGVSVEDAAAAVLSVFSESLRSFLAEMTIVQGLDPRDCLLVAGGGAAGLNIVSVARELSIDRIVIPTLAAGLCAVGGQFADVFSSFSRSVQTTTSDPDHKSIGRALEEIERDTHDFFERSAGAGSPFRELVCEARYANQLWEIDVPLPETWSGQTAEDLAELSLRFDRLHRSLFSVDQPGERLELLGFRGDARVARRRPQLSARGPGEGAQPVARRPVRFAGVPAARDTPVYRGDGIPKGAQIEGPAVIEEATTTILLDPGCVATAASAHYRVDLQDVT
jgi:N-methylhydantoinase A